MDGILLLFKEKGDTSHDAISRVKRHFKINKVGHTGTLDPLAEGLLMVLLDNATKIAPFSHFNKEYEIDIKFGIQTSSDDLEGEIIKEAPVPPDLESALKSVISSFMGKIKQTPPAFSAIKIDGKKLYKLARRGIAVDIPERDVEIFDIEILSVAGDIAKLRVCCSTGTYMRSLARDIGEKLNSCATLNYIKRTKIGKFKVEDATTLDGTENLETIILPINDVLYNLQKIELSAEEHTRVVNGMTLENTSYTDGEFLKLVYDNKVTAIGEIVGDAIKVKRGIEI